MTAGTAVGWTHQIVPSADGTPIGVTSGGSGEGVVVVGGALRAAVDYLPLAAELARSHRVHVVDRRGRGASAPQGPDYSLAVECADLAAVQRATGATLVFGHSYGGLVVLALAAGAQIGDPAGFRRIALYEPGLSIAGSIPTGWIPRYRQLLARGRRRAAFAHFVRESGGAPAIVTRLPEWYLRAVLPLVVRGGEWARTDALLGANAVEHEQVALAAGAGLVDRLGRITAEVLVLGGGRTPAALVTEPFAALAQLVPRCHTELLAGLDHLGPSDHAGPEVAARLTRFFDHGD